MKTTIAQGNLESDATAAIKRVSRVDEVVNKVESNRNSTVPCRRR
jgi:hypothetical protein